MTLPRGARSYDAARGAQPGTYAERLAVPLRWWVQGTMLVASLWLATVVALPPAGVVAGDRRVALALLAGAAARPTASARIEVADGGCAPAGPASTADHLGAVAALDADAARRLAGRDADARAYLLLRPYLKRAVRVEITDPADPAPYWLLSTRRPDELAAR